MVVALLMVSNRLDRVGSYPAEVQEPTLDTSGDEDNAIAWLVLRHDRDAEQPSTDPIHGYFDLLDQVVKDRLQRVPGVADVRIYGGTAREMQVEVDPERLAQYHLTVPELLDALCARPMRPSPPVRWMKASGGTCCGPRVTSRRSTRSAEWCCGPTATAGTNGSRMSRSPTSPP